MCLTRRLAILMFILTMQNWRTEALRILGLFPGTAPSHFVPSCILMRELANRGHQVDVISHFPLKKPVANYTDLRSGTAPQLENNMTYQEALDMADISIHEMVQLTGIMPCDLLSNEVFQQLLRTPKNTYDVIVLELLTANCFIAFGEHLNAPIVGTVMPRIHDWLYSPFGIPLNTAYMLGLFSTPSQSMTFFERLGNTLLMNRVALQTNYYIEDEREHVEKYFGRKLSSMYELYDDVSLVLVNSHHSISGIVPIPPGVIEELQKWLDDSQSGCVYFSFGSMLRIETFPREKLRAFYDTFENIAPVRVLMKIVDPTMLPSGLPKNVMTSPWLPQVAIFNGFSLIKQIEITGSECKVFGYQPNYHIPNRIGTLGEHPNVKVFITHGGLMGTTEAVAHCVPMIGVPFFADQFSNIRLYENKGVAIGLNHHEITGNSLTKAVKAVLTNSSYSNNIKKLSKLFYDRPMGALDTAVYWVEYTARHGDVLKSPATKLSWWQNHSLDVYGFISCVVLVILYTIVKFFQLVSKSVHPRKLIRITTSILKSKKFN